jgi:hypothetical protein
MDSTSTSTSNSTSIVDSRLEYMNRVFDSQQGVHMDNK